MSSLQQSRLLKVKWNSRWQGNDSTKILKNSIFYKFYCMINLSQIKRFGVYQNWLNSRGFSRHTDIARREKKAYVDFCQSNFLSNYMTYNQGIKFCSQAFIHTHTHTHANSTPIMRRKDKLYFSNTCKSRVAICTYNFNNWVMFP
jgi:hypothetical protein